MQIFSLSDNLFHSYLAIGVANNNLGTMVLQEQMEKSSTVAKNDEVYYKGIHYFDEAIRYSLRI